MFILGCDQSLKCTAITIGEFDKDFNLVDLAFFYTTTLKKFIVNCDNVYSCHVDKHLRGCYTALEIQKNFSEFLKKFIAKRNYTSYAGIEGGSYSSSTNSLFQLGQLSGLIISVLRRNGFKIREYEPTRIKKFATMDGSSDKFSMRLAWDKENNEFLDSIRKYLKSDFSKLSGSVASDIVDSYFIFRLLETEIKLRNGITLMKDLDPHHIEIFNTVTKANPVNILAQQFLC